jgi:hypothetical protein
MNPPAVSTVASARRRSLVPVLLALVALLALALPASAAASKGAVLTLKTARVGAPGNPAVGIVPFTDAIYRNCSEAPPESSECLMVGGVKYGYGIGQLEITVAQWVAFLNTADPSGKDPHHLYDSSQSSTAWPRFGQVDFRAKARPGRHYNVASPEWADKPFGFATFPRAARFVNSLYNGKVLSTHSGGEAGFRYVTYRVRLSKRTESGMYDFGRDKGKGPTRAHKTGFVVPSQNEWIKAAYYDASGGGTYSYWKYPTNPGSFGAGAADAPAPTTLEASNGDVTNSATQPLATYHAQGLAAPSWCPRAARSVTPCSTANPFGIDPITAETIFQGSLSTVGQAKTPSPWGTLDQGGNVVEWTDTITASPTPGDTRVWRRLHGGIANAPAYQLWLSAVGLQPQDNAAISAVYPWIGFRVGVLGKPGDG